MNKSSFLTFVCAMVPGAGQMYLGYLHRGLWHMSMFCFALALCSVLSLFGLALPVLWAFAFFDTFALRNQLKQGYSPEDVNPYGLDESGSLGEFLAKRHTLLGWLLILIGGYAILDRFILSYLQEVLTMLHLYRISRFISSLPTFIISVLLVLLGIWLIRGRKLPEPDESEYQPYAPAESAPEPKKTVFDLALGDVPAPAPIWDPAPGTEQATPEAAENTTTDSEISASSEKEAGEEHA